MLVALLMFGGGDGYRVTATFENAGQLVKGNQVRVGGRPVGTIEKIELNDHAQAEVEMTVEDGVAPLHRGTQATIRATSLSGIANRYVSLQPGPNDAGQIASGGRIDADDTSAPVDLDQLFNALDPGARKGLQQVIKGGADWYQGRAPDAARSLKYFAPALNSTSRLTRELVVDDEVFSRFITDTSNAMGAIAERRDDLSGLVQNTGTALGAIGDENVALARALDLLPGTLRKSNTTFVNLRAALDDLDVLVEESKTGTRDLAPFLRRLRPLVADARPTIRDLRTLIRTPGSNNDLIELTGKLPRLQRLTSTVFPRANRTFDRSQEFVDTLRQYTPDLAGWFTKFGQVASAYDANGHYARIQPIVGLFDYDEDTGELTRKPDAQRIDGYGSGQQRRCPGAAVQPPPDGSAPYPVPECDPNQTPPGG
ncbi:MAG TPA: MlaD family protein [Thermoleophilaceae bacterium]|nr:MlaD family protein [Thermoleophilaceae bacterium]